MEIIVERLRREYNIDLISTTPSVEYRISIDDKEEEIIDNPTEFPGTGQ